MGGLEVGGGTAKLDAAATQGLLGVEDSLAYRINEVDRHLHNRVRYWGSDGSPDETTAIAKGVDNPFVAVSGADTWGTAIPICGTDDVPVPTGDVKFDPHLILVVDTEHTTPYLFRLIWGTGTSAAAIAAEQYTEEMFVTAVVGPFGGGVPVNITARRVDVGTKLWAQVWSATDTSEVDFFWGTHGYEG